MANKNEKKKNGISNAYYIPLHSQARKTFEKGGVNFRNFSKVDANLKKIPVWSNIRSVNTFSGEKLHDFEIVCMAMGCDCTPAPPLHMGLTVMVNKENYYQV